MHFSSEEMNEFLEYENRIAVSLKEKVRNIHIKKYNSLQNIRKNEFDIKPNKKWFINKTNIDVPSDIQWIFSLGEKYILPTKKEEFPTLKMIADGEDLIQTIQKKEEQEIARNKLTIIIDNHINKMKLTNRDKFVLDKVKEAKKFLNRNKDILILRSDKGNTTVAINKNDYKIRIDNILGDVNNYKLLNKDPTNRLQKINNNIADELFQKDIITITEKTKLKTNSATAPKLYGLPKIHKKDFPLRPICSFINSPSIELCRYITNILKNITKDSKYNIKNSLEFKYKINNQTILDNEKLVSFDVISLFPNIPIDLAMNTIEEKWNDIEKYTMIEKDLFLKILKFCIEDNRYFQYDNRIYIQNKGLPMGSPASPIVADIIMEKLLDDCIEKLDIKPKIITKYVDDLFCIINKDGIDNMLKIFNDFNTNIKFTIEEEHNSRLPYLDTVLIRRENKLLLNWYQKPMASGRIINYYSKHNRRIIINTARNLIEKVFNISDREFHKENKEKIITILKDNSFPLKLIYKLINQFKNKIRNNNNNDDTMEPKIYKSITYIPGISERINRSNIFDTNKYKIAFRTYNTLNRLFSKTKDKTKKLDMSNVVYKIPCKGNDNINCNKVYVGTTKNKLKTRIAGHKSDQKYRNNNFTQKTALSSHCFKFNHDPDFENVSILNTEQNQKRRYILETLQIINTPNTQRINYKTDIDNVAQNYRHLVHKINTH